MSQAVQIAFDCLPLRSIGRVDIPLDASPAFRARCERIKHALETHGSHNTYYLENAHCTFHLTNDPAVGMLKFRFEGTVFTDEADRRTVRTDLAVELVADTCEWITEPVVQWMQEAVSRAVAVEFDRYIAAGDLQKAVERMQKLQAEQDAAGGFLGMGL